MKKLIALTFILFINVCSYSQGLYKESVSLLQNGEYAKADSVLTECIKKYPNSLDLYFNRAIARLKLNNMRGFCIDMKSAISTNDDEAETIYCRNCLNIDTIFYNSNYEECSKLSKYKEIVFREKYRDYVEGKIYGEYNKLIACYCIEDNYKYFTKIPKCDELNNISKIIQYHIDKFIKYPEDERDAYYKYAGAQSTINVQIDISLLGEITNLNILNRPALKGEKDYNKYFRREVLRVFKNIRIKQPLHFMGESIVLRLKIPVSFKFPKFE